MSKNEEMKSITFEYSFTDNTSDEDVTPLMVATVYAQDQVASLLLSKGVNMNAETSRHSWTVLCLAIIYGHTQLVVILLKKNAKNKKDNAENKITRRKFFMFLERHTMRRVIYEDRDCS